MSEVNVQNGRSIKKDLSNNSQSRNDERIYPQRQHNQSLGYT